MAIKVASPCNSGKDGLLPPLNPRRLLVNLLAKQKVARAAGSRFGSHSKKRGGRGVFGDLSVRVLEHTIQFFKQTDRPFERLTKVLNSEADAVRRTVNLLRIVLHGPKGQERIPF